MKKAEAKIIKVEWCENWIKSKFMNHPIQGGGIEVNHFWRMAEEAGLWVRGTYGSPMSEALQKMTKVKIISDDDGNYKYSVFKLAE